MNGGCKWRMNNGYMVVVVVVVVSPFISLLRPIDPSQMSYFSNATYIPCMNLRKNPFTFFPQLSQHNIQEDRIATSSGELITTACIENNTHLCHHRNSLNVCLSKGWHMYSRNGFFQLGAYCH